MSYLSYSINNLFIDCCLLADPSSRRILNNQIVIFVVTSCFICVLMTMNKKLYGTCDLFVVRSIIKVLYLSCIKQYLIKSYLIESLSYTVLLYVYIFRSLSVIHSLVYPMLICASVLHVNIFALFISLRF